jgi:hypothetical protein
MPSAELDKSLIGCFVDHRVGGGPEPRQQGWHVGLVGGLPGGQDEAQRQPEGLGQDMKLGAQSSTRPTDGVMRAPFSASSVLVGAHDR